MFRRPLGDGHDIHLGQLERLEHSGGYPGMPRHSETHHRQDRHTSPGPHRLEFTMGDLRPECAVQHVDRVLGDLVGHGEVNRIFGRSLGNERDRYAGRLQRTEGAGRHPRDTQNARPGDGDQRLIANRRQRPNWGRGTLSPGADFGSGRRRITEGTYAQGRARSRQRQQGAWVQYLRTVISELGCLCGMHEPKQACIGHHPRIGGEQTRHVLPERHLWRCHRATERCRREIGPAPAKRGEPATGCAAEESRYHRRHTAREQWLERGPRRALGGLHARCSAAVGAIGDDHSARVHRFGRLACSAECTGKQEGAQLLAAGHDVVPQSG